MQQYISRYMVAAPIIGRILLGLIFLHSALYKIPGSEFFGFQVQTSGDAGIPFPALAVTLAFILEVVGGIALIIGWHTRKTATVLIAFVILIMVFFVRDLSDMTQMTIFFSCLQLIAGLLYISAFGPGKFSADNRQAASAEMAV